MNPERLPSATNRADERAGRRKGKAASSPAGHGHLHPRGRDGRTQLVQVPDARSAGVPAVHLGWRSRGLVPRPHPELRATEGSEPSSSQTGLGVEGGGKGERRRQFAGWRREEGGGPPSRAAREQREPVPPEAEAAREVVHRAPGFPAPSLQDAAPERDTP